MKDVLEPALHLGLFGKNQQTFLLSREHQGDQLYNTPSGPQKRVSGPKTSWL